MKKFFLLLLSVLLLYGCEEKRDSVVRSASDLAGEISRNVTLDATREYVPESPNSEDILRNYYYIGSGDLFDDFCILLPQEKSRCEIAVFRFSEENGQRAAENAVKLRANTVKKMCKARKLDIPVTILNYKNAVILIMTPDKNDEIREIVERTVPNNSEDT